MGYRYVWEKFRSILEQAIVIIASAILAFITLSLAGEALLRVFFHITWGFMEEFPRLFMTFLVFLMLGLLYRHGRHIEVDMLEAYLEGRPRTKAWLKLAVNIVSLGGACMLFYAGIFGVKGFRMMGYMSVTEITLPLWIVYLSLPIGAAILMLFIIEMLFKNIKEIACGSSKSQSAKELN